MIKDVIIIKDGIPLFSRNYCGSGTNSHRMFIEQNDLIMVSGFFSALNSFSEEFDNFGPIKELKLTNTELKLSFLKDRSIPNLIYLATFDERSKGVNVQRALRKISRTFLTRYNIESIVNWSGRTDAFDGMRDLVKKYIDEEEEENDHDKEKSGDDVVLQAAHHQANVVRGVGGDLHHRRGREKGLHFRDHGLHGIGCLDDVLPRALHHV